MKKVLLLLIFVSCFLFSARGALTSLENENNRSQQDRRKELENMRRIIEIDGCEYIETSNECINCNSGLYSLTHKGNCKNPVHVCPQPVKK